MYMHENSGVVHDTWQQHLAVNVARSDRTEMNVIG